MSDTESRIDHGVTAHLEEQYMMANMLENLRRLVKPVAPFAGLAGIVLLFLEFNSK